MNKKIKLLIALTGVLAVIIIALVINDKNAQQKRAALSSQSQNSAQTAFKPIPAYESLDEIVAGINSDVNLDTTVANENDASASYVGQFDSSINLNNLYNASNF